MNSPRRGSGGDAQPGVLSASVGVGYQSCDSPTNGACAIVVTDGDAGDAQARARSHCRVVLPPIHTILSNIFGASVSEATMRPNPAPRRGRTGSPWSGGGGVKSGSTRSRHRVTRCGTARPALDVRKPF
jgi:hypothetical protein